MGIFLTSTLVIVIDVLIFIAFAKTYIHFSYRRLCRGEKPNPLQSIIEFSPFLFPDIFSSLFFFMVFGKNRNTELEKMRRRINKMIWIIYTCIALITLCAIHISILDGA